MSLGLAAPLFAAGAALLVLPYLIHQIRRPERKPIPFSSLMFVPDIKHEVIERRRVQHILLMLLRMLCLLFLCFAFSRPYWRDTVAEAANPDGVTHHVVLVDRSFSLEAGDAFEEAKAKARTLISGLPIGDRVGVIAFDDHSETLAPLFRTDDPEAGSRERATDALATVALSERETNFVAALQSAEAMLRGAAEGREAETIGQVVHVISDFQRTGIPISQSDWKLPASITVETVSVGKDRSNVAVEDVAVQDGENGQIRIRAKVRNWSETAVTTDVQLTADGDISESQSLTIEPANAMQVSFTIAQPATGALRGAVRVATGGDLARDDVRYFAWNPREPNRIALIGRTGSTARPSSADFVRIALNGISPDLALETIEPAALAMALSEPGPPVVVIVTDPSGLDSATITSLLEYERDGGHLLVLLESTDELGASTAQLLEALGVQHEGLRFEGLRESRFDLLASIKLDHPIFQPFRGAEFNDFSALRFNEYHCLTANEDVRVLATFEGDGHEWPAVLEGSLGNGSWVVWPFPLDLTWTNVPKNPRFVPVLLETVKYQSPTAESWKPLTVGEPVAITPRDGANWLATLPGSTEGLGLDTRPIPASAGYVKVASAQKERFLAVNVPAEEGDLAAIPESEFQIRLASAPITLPPSDEETLSETNEDGESVVDYEYGRWVIAALVALMACEGIYAAGLASRRTQESAS